MSAFRQDLVYGLRLLLKKPGFTVTAALSLGLGIGANTTIFSLINVTLLRPLPFPESNRLVAIWQAPVNHRDQRDGVNRPAYRAGRSQIGSFDARGGFFG